VSLPAISIVTPSYNQGAFLESTIRSVIGQDYPNLEYIVVDGGSSDQSPEIVERYKSHFKFSCSERDGGHIPALNKGFGHATGDIMGWLNSDDTYFPWTLRTVASIMTAFPQIEWLTTLRPAYVDYHGFCINVEHRIPAFSREAFLDGCYITPVPADRTDMLGLYPTVQQESTFWRRSLWERAGGRLRTEFKLAADFDLWGRFYEHAELYGTLAPLAGFRFQFAQKTSAWQDYAQDAHRSLVEVRARAGWKGNDFRRRAIRYRLDEIPKLRKYVIAKCAYHGTVVVRRNPGRPEASWDLQPRSFFRPV